MKPILVSLIFLLTASTTAFAAEQNQDFETLKGKLAGSWTFVEDKKTYDEHFDLISQGAALMEQNEGYTAVYYPDGNSLMMTLYTKDGNQPRLRSQGIDKKTQSVTFTFQDVTNLKTGSGHINGLTIIFKDKNHFVEQWKMLQPDGSEFPFAFELTRKNGK